MSLTDQQKSTFSIRHSIEKANEFLQKAFIDYVDFKAKIDSVDRNSFWNVVSNTGLLSKHVRLFKAIPQDTVLFTGERQMQNVVSSRHFHQARLLSSSELFDCIIDYTVTWTTRKA